MENVETSGNFRKGLSDPSNLKRTFRNIQCVISILCSKFGLKQSQQHRLVLLISGMRIEI